MRPVLRGRKEQVPIIAKPAKAGGAKL